MHVTVKVVICMRYVSLLHQQNHQTSVIFLPAACNIDNITNNILIGQPGVA